MTTTLPRRRDTIAALPELRLGAESSGAAADWMASLEGRKAPRTIAQYVGTVNDLLAMWDDVTPQDFHAGHLDELLRGYPLASRRIRRCHLNSFFKYLSRRDIIGKNPVDAVDDFPAKPKPIFDIFDLTEIEVLCSLPQPDGVLMRLLFDTGVRAGEAGRLRTWDVHMDENYLRVADSKRGKSRLIPLTNRLRLALVGWFEADELEDDAWLFYTTPGGQFRDHAGDVSYTSFARWWRRCLDSARIRYRNPHTMRHSYATWARRTGMDSDELRQNLGHAKIATTLEMYVHQTVNDRRDSTSAFEAGTQ